MLLSSNSELSSRAEWAHGGALGGVGREEQRAPAAEHNGSAKTQLRVESQISRLWLLETCSSDCVMVGSGAGF